MGTSMAANAVAVVARPAVESAKTGLVCNAISPCSSRRISFNVTELQ